MDPVVDIGQVVSGFFVGTVVGLTGVGGGALMTPILVLIFGVAPTTAVGTDLLFAAVTKSGGTWVHARHGTVDWRITGLLALGSLPATVLTLSLCTHYLPGGLGGARTLVTSALGVALILTAIALICRQRLFACVSWWQGHQGEVQTQAAQYRRRAIMTVITGLTLGTLVSLTSVGAGAMGVTALMLLYPMLPAARIVGSDLAHAVPLTLAAGIGHWWLGNVDWVLLGSLLLGSLPGIFIGSHVAPRLPERLMRPILATMLVLVGGRLIAA